LEFAVFLDHSREADAVTAEILRGVLKDERRHIGFGENELGRRIVSTPHIRPRLNEIKKELDHHVLEALAETTLLLGMPRGEEERIGRAYLESVERLGFGP
jgi:hypothetical protein